MSCRARSTGLCAFTFLLAIGMSCPAWSAEFQGKVKSVDVEGRTIVLNQDGQPNELTVNLTTDTTLRSLDQKPLDIVAVKPGMIVAVTSPSLPAAAIRAGSTGERTTAFFRSSGQLPAQPLQAPAPLLLPGLPGPDPEGPVRVPLCHVPGLDDLPADRHRLARRRGAGAPEPRPHQVASSGSCSSAS